MKPGQLANQTCTPKLISTCRPCGDV